MEKIEWRMSEEEAESSMGFLRGSLTREFKDIATSIFANSTLCFLELQINLSVCYYVLRIKEVLGGWKDKSSNTFLVELRNSCIILSTIFF